MFLSDIPHSVKEQNAEKRCGLPHKTFVLQGIGLFMQITNSFDSMRQSKEICRSRLQMVPVINSNFSSAIIPRYSWNNYHYSTAIESRADLEYNSDVLTFTLYKPAVWSEPGRR